MGKSNLHPSSLLLCDPHFDCVNDTSAFLVLSSPRRRFKHGLHMHGLLCFFNLLPLGRCSSTSLSLTTWARLFYFIIFQDFIYLFLDRREGRWEGGKHQWVVACHAPPTGDLACNPGMCPDWESNHSVRRLALSPLSHTSQGYDMNMFKECKPVLQNVLELHLPGVCFRLIWPRLWVLGQNSTELMSRSSQNFVCESTPHQPDPAG